MSKAATPARADEAGVVAPLERGWPAPLRGARAAFVSFSRLPVGGFPYAAGDWHWAPAHLPRRVLLVVGMAVTAGAVQGLPIRYRQEEISTMSPLHLICPAAAVAARFNKEERAAPRCG